LHVSVPRSATLPRRIAPGIFFVDPGWANNDDADADDLLPSISVLVNLEITHAVVRRGPDLALACGMKALFVGPHDPLSKIVAWMRAVRQLGANMLVSDFAAAAGYLVVELGLTPRSAWLRIARGVPPVGDLVLTRLCALAIVHREKGRENGNGQARGGYGSGCSPSVDENGVLLVPRSCRGQRVRTRAESGLKHVIVT
jgi:hypothetical protein